MSLIVVTPGDPDGIGPEIVIKAIRKIKKTGSVPTLLCVGSKAPLEKLGARFIELKPNALPTQKLPRSFDFFLIAAPTPTNKKLHPAGYQSGWSIETATRIVQKVKASALVTGPIHKERLNQGGYKFTGHTDFLSKLCKDAPVTMMLANETLRVSLVTTHIGLKSVSDHVTQNRIIDTTLRTYSFLKNHLGIKKPKIAICSLNPHAGEGGMFGNEDDSVVSPAIRKLKKSLGTKTTLSGPHPSDTFFAKHVSAPKLKRADAVICMYHDQGLIPVKLIDFPNTVNITLGLPIIRTSVDHGTAFDIAGKNLADPSSMIAAIRTAALALRSSSRKTRK